MGRSNPRPNLRQNALEQLRRRITTGELAPGTHIGEVAMSEELQISRGTLREALRELQREGLVVYGDRGRVSVRLIDEKDIIGTFSVRSALECLAAETIATSYRRAKATVVLRERVAAMDEAVGQSLTAQIEADLAFHEKLCELSGNDTLLRHWKMLEGAIRMCVMYSGLERAQVNMSPHRHLEIVEAIESGDTVRARHEIQQHMSTTAQTLLFGAFGPAAAG